MPFRPMLSGKAEDATLRFPLLASPKLDGVRTLAMNGQPMSRSMKFIPNRYVQRLFADHATMLEGLDGELIVGAPTALDCYRKTASGVMSEDGEPDVRFFVFDMWTLPGTPFEDRLEAARQRIKMCPPFVHFLDHAYVQSEVELLDYERAVLAIGYEGVMLRDPKGLYKQGRSTAKEGALLKLKRFEDAEAVIVGVEERMHNTNSARLDERGYTKRSTHQDNKIGTDSLGALVVRGLNAPFEGVEFNIGTGFDEADRAGLWARRAELPGQVVKYKFFSVGVKDAPRHPVFLGFRDGRDLAA